MRKLIIGVLWLASLVAAYLAGHDKVPEPLTIVETRIDTVRIVCPEVAAIYVRGERTEKLPLATPDSVDSIDVVVPISQAVYTGEDYRAYVSGFRPALDSLILSSTHFTIAPTSRREAPRWSIGVQAGYGITPHGFQPFIGIGVSFRIL